MTMPSFLVIGAAKSGTTSLYHYLVEHPQVFLAAIKEPHFFAFEAGWRPRGSPKGQIVRTLDEYQALFAAVTVETAIGECSTGYISIPGVADKIYRRVPNVKLIALLRDPVERAYSDFLMYVRLGVEPYRDFAKAIDEQDQRLEMNLAHGHYLTTGFYYTHLKPYYKIFDAKQIRIFLYEDFSDNTGKLLRDIFGFIDVDDTFTPDIRTKYNRSGIPNNRLLHSLMMGPRWMRPYLKANMPSFVVDRLTRLRDKNLYRPELEPEMRSALMAVFREDTLRLQNLIRKDLSQWLD